MGPSAASTTNLQQDFQLDSTFNIVLMVTACGVANARCPRNRYRACYNATGRAMVYGPDSGPCSEGFGEVCCRVSVNVFNKVGHSVRFFLHRHYLICVHLITLIRMTPQAITTPPLKTALARFVAAYC
ncbi:hypothetical protein PSHT_10570 [Puccinia striiformis]|uniref:Uncharacterized protein n=1 Tax=Puccinia striiformis TaxID=27350 RepID=A0A2S4V8S8_9BASI|nr:hypothetical protein PSHT_10570 [Puccinia striiformis]